MGMDNLPWVLAYGAKGAAMKLENDYKNKAFDLQKQNTLADNARQESMLGLNKQKFAFDQQRQTAFGQLAAQGMLSPQQIMQGMADGSIDQGTGALALKTAISAQNSNTNLYSKGATADYRNQMHGTTTPLPSGFPGATPMPPGAQRVQPIPMGMGGQPPAPPGGNQIGVSIPDGTGPSEITNAAQQQMQKGAPAGIQMDGTRDQVTEPTQGEREFDLGSLVPGNISINDREKNYAANIKNNYAAQAQSDVSNLHSLEQVSQLLKAGNFTPGIFAAQRGQMASLVAYLGGDPAVADDYNTFTKNFANIALNYARQFPSANGKGPAVYTQQAVERAKGTEGMTAGALSRIMAGVKADTALNYLTNLAASRTMDRFQYMPPDIADQVMGMLKKPLLNVKTSTFNDAEFRRVAKQLKAPLGALGLDGEDTTAPQGQQPTGLPQGWSVQIEGK